MSLRNTISFEEELSRKFKVALDAVKALPFSEDAIAEIENILNEHYATSIKTLARASKHGVN
jgi:hypothetical protein